MVCSVYVLIQANAKDAGWAAKRAHLLSPTVSRIPESKIWSNLSAMTNLVEICVIEANYTPTRQ